MTNKTETNRATVREFYEMAFNRRKLAEAAAKHMGETYRQHNPSAADGPEPFLAFVTGFATATPACASQ